VNCNSEGSTATLIRPKRIERSFDQINLSNIFPLSDLDFCFYDYGRDLFGAVRMESGSSWHSSCRGKQYIGRFGEGDAFVIRANDRLEFYNANSSEPFLEEVSNEEIIAIGRDWKVIKTSNGIEVVGKKCSTPFRVLNGIKVISQENGYLKVIERQGPLRVFDIETGEICFEQVPVASSEFRSCFVSKDEQVILTQHFFSEPKSTVLKTFNALGHTESSFVLIPKAGLHLISNDGERVLFADGTSYSILEGEMINGW